MLEKVSRQHYLDNLCGVLIINMIFMCHLGIFCGISKSQNDFPVIGTALDFFMAWFFFKSGMFFSKCGTHGLFVSVMKKLLVPYIVFTVIAIVVQLLVGIYQGQTSFVSLLELPLLQLLYNGGVVSNLPLWFLIALAIAKIVYKIGGGENLCTEIATIVFFFALAMLSNYISYVRPLGETTVLIGGKHVFLHYPVYLGNIFLGTTFYGLGHLLRNAQFNPIIFVLSAIVYGFHFIVPGDLSFSANFSPDCYPLAVLYNLASLVFYNNIFRLFCNREISALSSIGENSMIYYVTHFIFFFIVFSFLPKATGPNWTLWGMLIVPAIMFLIIMNFLFHRKSLQWMVGR